MKAEGVATHPCTHVLASSADAGLKVEPNSIPSLVYLPLA